MTDPTAMTDTRPVWLTEKQALDHGLAGTWDKAPADAYEAVLEAVWPDGQALPQGYEEMAHEVLCALGMPSRGDGAGTIAPDGDEMGSAPTRNPTVDAP